LEIPGTLMLRGALACGESSATGRRSQSCNSEVAQLSLEWLFSLLHSEQQPGGRLGDDDNVSLVIRRTCGTEHSGANGTRVSHVNLGHPCGPPSEVPSHFLGLSPFISHSIVTAARAPFIRKCTHSDEVQQGRLNHELKRKSKTFALYRKAKRASTVLSYRGRATSREGRGQESRGGE